MAEEGDSLLSVELTEKKEDDYTPCCYCLSHSMQTSLFATLLYVACSLPNGMSTAFIAKAGTEVGTSQVAIATTLSIQMLGALLGTGIFALMPMEHTFMWLTKVGLPVMVAATTMLGILGQVR